MARPVPPAACDACGCLPAHHGDNGCHGVQRLTPTDRETCVCRRTATEAGATLPDDSADDGTPEVPC